MLDELQQSVANLGDEHVAGSEVGDGVERHEEVGVVGELLADQALRLALVRGDEERLGVRAEPQRLAVRVEDGQHAAAVEVADRLGIEALVDAARERAGEHHVLGAAREVDQLLEQDLQLVLRDVRAPLVHLGVAAAGRIDDRGRGTRLVLDADEVVEDRLRSQLLDDARTGAASREAGGDDRDAELLQRAGDVDPLAAGEGQALARAMALAALEVRHGQRPIDRRVHGDGDDHETQPHMWCRVRVAYQPTRPATPGRDTEREATSGTAASRREPW